MLDPFTIYLIGRRGQKFCPRGLYTPPNGPMGRILGRIYTCPLFSSSSWDPHYRCCRPEGQRATFQKSFQVRHVKPFPSLTLASIMPSNGIIRSPIGVVGVAPKTNSHWDQIHMNNFHTFLVAR